MGEAPGGADTAGCASGPDAPWEPTMCAGPGPAAIASPPPRTRARPWPGCWRHVSTCEFHGLGSRPGEPTSSARYRLCCSTTRGGVPRCPCWDLEDLQILRIPIGGAPSRRTRRARRGLQLILHDCPQSDKSHRQCRPKPKRAPSKGPAFGRQRCFSAEGLVAWCEY